ncbi:MAG TPA: amidohydrolase family protein [Candidatus Angelobacter sp.]|nr:amidohydrolase family protein [Candidatus Angelobacter sp.]
MPRHTICALCLLALAATALSAQNEKRGDNDKRLAFVNGKWFDGKDFRLDTFYVIHGTLTHARPGSAIETVDLHGGYVIPALGEAHSHFPDQEGNFDRANGQALTAGVFYVLNPNDIAEKTNLLRTRLETPSTVDAVFAHAGFTDPGGHPKPLYESLVDRKLYAYQKSELEGRAFYSIGSFEDIAQKWPAFLATQPGFVKIYLLHSERYAQENSPAPSKGLRPEFAREIVRRAHKAGLRAGAHVESAADFHEALEAHVDLVMHLPGYWLESSNYEDYVIPERDAKLAARRGVYVVATAALLDAHNAKDDRLRQIQIENLRLLKRAGVKLLIGSDSWPGPGTQREVDYLQKTGVFTNLELLSMWCHATPHAIFPGRKIGEIRTGYAANFLVLSKNPLENLSALKEIRLRVKQGEVAK